MIRQHRTDRRTQFQSRFMWIVFVLFLTVSCGTTNTFERAQTPLAEEINQLSMPSDSVLVYRSDQFSGAGPASKCNSVGRRLLYASNTASLQAVFDFYRQDLLAKGWVLERVYANAQEFRKQNKYSLVVDGNHNNVTIAVVPQSVIDRAQRSYRTVWAIEVIYSLDC